MMKMVLEPRLIVLFGTAFWEHLFCDTMTRLHDLHDISNLGKFGVYMCIKKLYTNVFLHLEVSALSPSAI